MNNDLHQEIQQKVLARINHDAVHMRSRAYFAVRVVLTALLTAFVLALSAFVLSFILFSIHESGEDILLGFGFLGVRTFLVLFPWVPLALDIGCILVLEWLLQGFKIGYRLSLLTLFAGIGIVSALLALLVALTPLHGILLDRANHGALPILGDPYTHIHDSHRPRGIFRGTIESIRDKEITLIHNDMDRDLDDGVRIVRVPQGVPPDLHPGDRIYILGTSTDDTVSAYGISRFPPRR
ncbi:hypothetical protein HZC00_05440 [Candidatus Kaiserbacteria bacterium]|nr:hypothetical protein [Candidatus Kaiserbacteria bacterium]